MNMVSYVSRRQSLQGLALFGAGAAVGLAKSTSVLAQEASASDIEDEDIFQFALNLEYMETEYYLRATTGKGIDAAELGSDPGEVTGGRKVPFESKAIGEFAEELAQNELAHVRFYRETLGKQAVSRPTIDFEAGFAAAAKGAGLREFDPFANDMNFLLGGMLFEDVGVTAYAGAAPLIKKKEFLEAAAGILAVEAYHMGMARSQLYEMVTRRGKPPMPSRRLATSSMGRETRTRASSATERRTSCHRTRWESPFAARHKKCCASST
jgi:hypothetical protein